MLFVGDSDPKRGNYRRGLVARSESRRSAAGRGALAFQRGVCVLEWWPLTVPPLGFEDRCVAGEVGRFFNGR